VHREGIEPPTR